MTTVAVVSNCLEMHCDNVVRGYHVVIPVAFLPCLSSAKPVSPSIPRTLHPRTVVLILWSQGEQGNLPNMVTHTCIYSTVPFLHHLTPMAKVLVQTTGRIEQSMPIYANNYLQRTGNSALRNIVSSIFLSEVSNPAWWYPTPHIINSTQIGMNQRVMSIINWPRSLFSRIELAASCSLIQTIQLWNGCVYITTYRCLCCGPMTNLASLVNVVAACWVALRVEQNWLGQ